MSGEASTFATGMILSEGFLNVCFKCVSQFLARPVGAASETF